MLAPDAIIAIACVGLTLVVLIHGKVANDLGILSSDPFGGGWLMKVKLSAPLPADLLTRAEYEAHFKQHH